MALDPRQLGPERGGQGPGQHGLADAGHVLDEEMPAGERGDGGGLQRALAAEHDLLEVAHEGLAEGDRGVDATDALVENAHEVASTWAITSHYGWEPRPDAAAREAVDGGHPR